MITIHDVAKRAQVSLITVSRVVNNKGNVKDETRDRVLQAIAELNYYPNTCGRGLHSNRVNTIGVVMATIDAVNIHRTHFYNELMIGIEQVCMKNSTDLLVSMQKRYPGQVFDYLKLYFERKADGLILVSPGLTESQLEIIMNQDIPCVIIGERFPKYELNYVDSENRLGINKIGEIIIQAGHRKIAFLKGLESHGHIRERLAGFYDIVNKYQLNIPPEWIIEGDFSIESGKLAIKKLFSSGNMPTLIICCNDTMALGVLMEANKLGIKVPDQLSIVGFDGVDICKFTNPPLASIRQPLIEMGNKAAEILFQRLKEPKSPPELCIYPVELLRGGTLKTMN